MSQSQSLNDNFYRLQFDSHIPWRSAMRIILLIAAIVTDFFMVFSVIDCFVKSPLYVIASVSLIMLSAGMRIISTKMLYSYRYLYNNGYFRIIKAYSLGQKLCINVEITDIKDVRRYNANEDIGLKLLSCNDVEYDRYVITLKDNTQHVITPDEYMLALITRGKE